MKRIIAAFTALTVVIGLGTSCQKEMENGQEIPGNGTGLKITATIADNGTKVSYQEDGTDHSLQPTWQQDDIIIGFDGDGNTYGYKVTEVNEGVATLAIITEGEYKGDATTDPADGTEMYMFYAPGTKPSAISNKSLTVSLANQAKDVVPALMMVQATVTNESLSLQFHNKTAIIGVKAPVMADKNKAYTSLALSGSAGLNTEVKFDLDGEILQASYQTSGTLTKALDFTSDEITGKGPDVIYIVACPAATQNLSFKFNDTEEYFNVENVSIAANNYYRLEAPATNKQKFTVTVQSGITNGTITTDPSGSVEWGTEVTVTATPSDGYELATLTYNDGSDHDIKSSKSFTMPAKNVTVIATFERTINGHAYVTIGGKKWATTNIGATNPYDNGGLYSWGETETKSKYSDTKYTKKAKGISTDISPTSEYDVARVKWGEPWRMPTKENFTALANACKDDGDSGDSFSPTGTRASFAEVTYKGVYWITNYNSGDGKTGLVFCDGTNKLFFPAAGIGKNLGRTETGDGGYYWSSSLSFGDYAYRMDFNYGYVTPVKYVARYFGFSVRPVSD